MVQKKYYFYFLFSLCAVIFVLAGEQSRAEESDAVRKYDQQISDAKQEQKSLAKKTEELQKEMEEIEKSKDETLVYIEKLDKKSAALEASLENLKGQIQTATKELDTANKELKEAEATEQKQYTTMKKRIKYMYENGSQDYLEILFSSKDISDLLNRTEYIEKISSYDQGIFEKYKETKRQITQKKSEIEVQLSELKDMQAEETAEKETLTNLREKKELKRYNEQIDISQEKADEYARQAAEAEAEVEKLLQERQKEIDRQNAVGYGNSGEGDGSLRWPLTISGRISSGFGKRKSPTAGASTYHKGLDIAAPSGTPIVAAAEGKVVTAAYSSSAGNYVMIAHGNSLYTVYMHCSRLAVKEGDNVKAGEFHWCAPSLRCIKEWFLCRSKDICQSEMS